MPATVTSLLNNITLANSNAGFSVWKRGGSGGTPSAITETDVFLQGSGACSVKVSKQQIVLAYGTGGVNLGTANTQIYIWVNMLASGLMVSRANNGLGIFVSSDTNLFDNANWQVWTIHGFDTYPGGWVRLVIDTAKPSTFGVGTPNMSNIRWVGVYCDVLQTAKFDNLVVDRIDYSIGPALRVTGTSTPDALIEDIIDADTSSANQWGLWSEKEGVAYVKCKTLLGDSGTNSSDLTATDTVVVIEEPVYWNGTSEDTCVFPGTFGIDIVSSALNTTSVQFGKIVGSGDTARGRNGLTVLSSHALAEFNADDPDIDTLKLYGTTFRSITGGVSLGTNTAHEVIGTTFDQCGQVIAGSVIHRNNVFSGYSGARGALLWGNFINIKSCSFLSNTDPTNDPAGIEIPAGTAGPLTIDALTFNGNDFDVYFADVSIALTLNSTNGSNPSTSRTDGGSVSIQNAVGIELSNLVPGSQIYVRNTTDGVDLYNQTVAGTTFSDSLNYTGDKSLMVRVRKSSEAPYYKAFQTTGTLTSNGFSLTVNQIQDS